MGQMLGSNPADLFGKEATRTRGGDADVRAVKSVEPVVSESGDTVLFVVNYADNKGWALLSANVEDQPIVAYNDVMNFSTEGLTAENPLDGWMKDRSARISYRMRQPADPENPYRKMWENLETADLTRASMTTIVPEGGTRSTHPDPREGWVDIDHMGARVTRWGQHAPFNNTVPGGCLVGCPAVALGILFKDRDWPNTTAHGYDYSKMPYNSDGYWDRSLIPAQSSTALEDMLYDIGYRFNTLHPIDYKAQSYYYEITYGENTYREPQPYYQYSPNESSSTMDTTIDMLRYCFGYGGAYTTIFNISDNRFYENLQNGPVLLRAGWAENKGHIWVCCGYEERQIGAQYSDYLYMNWGSTRAKALDPKYPVWYDGWYDESEPWQMKSQVLSTKDSTSVTFTTNKYMFLGLTPTYAGVSRLGSRSCSTPRLFSE